ncbi:MAG: hypothetical protein WBV70_04680 [Candidatus Bathyarchaeia archaeon]
MDASFEEISRKYRSVKTGKTSVDLLALKFEIESYIKCQQSSKRRGNDSLLEVEDMLIDLTQMIEEGHCNPMRSKKL